MENDERDRREWPGEDSGETPAEPEWTPSDEPAPSPPGGEDAAPTADAWTPAPDEPAAPSANANADADAEPSPRRDEPASAPAEIESWPSQQAETPSEQPDEPAWPTQPPAAGSGDSDTWPTAAPEVGEQRDVEPASVGDEPAPQEVEAYPAAAAHAGDHSTASAPAHSVPDAQASTGESTQCPRCGTENRAGLSFCRDCGQRLVAAGVATTVERPGAPEGTMACPRCGTHNRAGVGFCQNCGANLRGTAEGYVPPAVAADREAAPAEPARRGAILGPIVLLIGLVGLVTAYLLPFAYGSNSLSERALGSDGYGIAFWNGYPDVAATLADQAYFGLAGPVPLLGALLAVLAIAGFVRAAPGPLQTIGLVVALLWAVGLIVLFVVVELAGNWGGDIVGLLRDLTPAGIIFFLSSLIILIGALTRFGRS